MLVARLARRLDEKLDQVLRFCRQRRLALFGAVLYLAILFLWLLTQGFPMETRPVVELALIGLFCASLNNLKRVARGVLVDWLPFFLILFTYDQLRRRADEVSEHVHIAPQWTLDHWLGHGTTLTTHLQHWLWSGRPRWWDYISLCVYLSHFVVTIGVAVVLWLRGTEMFRAFRAAVVTMFGLALLTYAAYPAAPPWWVNEHGAAPVHRLVVDTIDSLAGAGAAPPDPQIPTSVTHLYNPVAALPSLHAALPMVLLVFFWRSHRKFRPLLVTYAVAMAFTLVYTGEHFAFDILLGWIFAAGSVLLARRIRSAWHRRASPQRPPTTIHAQPSHVPELPVATATTGPTAAP